MKACCQCHTYAKNREAVVTLSSMSSSSACGALSNLQSVIPHCEFHSSSLHFSDSPTPSVPPPPAADQVGQFDGRCRSVKS